MKATIFISQITEDFSQLTDYLWLFKELWDKYFTLVSHFCDKCAKVMVCSGMCNKEPLTCKIDYLWWQQQKHNQHLYCLVLSQFSVSFCPMLAELLGFVSGFWHQDDHHIYHCFAFLTLSSNFEIMCESKIMGISLSLF